MKHAELIARLEAAEVGCAEMGHDVWVMVTGESILSDDRPASERYPLVRDGARDGSCIPPVTTSLDAALALAERVMVGDKWEFGVTGYEVVTANLAGFIGVAKTPALALCIAILKALEAKQ